MQDNLELNNLKTPLNDLLFSLGHSKHNCMHHFNLSTLFWSQTRLFELYYRIMSVVNLPDKERVFLESDIESFIIRMRIVLNDIAFIIRQLLPEQHRGLKNPRGGVHPKNKEMSINDLFKFVKENTDDFPEFTEVLKKNEEWIFRLKNERDNIVHYKSRVIILETEPSLSFAMINAEGTEAIIPTPEGGNRIVTTPIFEYINSQMLSLYKLLNSDLVNTIRQYLKNNDIQFQEMKMDSQMSCIGISLFKSINEI